MQTMQNQNLFVPSTKDAQDAIFVKNSEILENYKTERAYILLRKEFEKSVKEYVFKHLPDEISEGKKLFLVELSKQLKLNPWKKEIYFLPFKNSKTGEVDVSVIISYLVYINRAIQSGRLDGFEVDISFNEKGEPKSATCIIYRKDFSKPFKWTVYFNEVAKKTYDKNKREWVLSSLWREQPSFMLRKVAISQAMRICFPEIDLPVAAEEEFRLEQLEELLPGKELEVAKEKKSSELPESPSTNPLVEQAKKLAEAKGVEIDVEEISDSEWQALYQKGLLTKKLAKGTKISSLLAALKKQ